MVENRKKNGRIQQFVDWLVTSLRTTTKKWLMNFQPVGFCALKNLLALIYLLLIYFYYWYWQWRLLKHNRMQTRALSGVNRQQQNNKICSSYPITVRIDEHANAWRWTSVYQISNCAKYIELRQLCRYPDPNILKWSPNSVKTNLNFLKFNGNDLITKCISQWALVFQDKQYVFELSLDLSFPNWKTFWEQIIMMILAIMDAKRYDIYIVT